MISIVLTNGKIININANITQLDKKGKIINLINDYKTIARINIDNVAGCIATNYIENKKE